MTTTNPIRASAQACPITSPGRPLQRSRVFFLPTKSIISGFGFLLLFGLSGLVNGIHSQQFNLDKEAPKPINEGLKVINAVKPAYPPIAAARRISGKVVVVVDVDVNGMVTEAHAQSGHPVLLTAAQNAAGRWRFNSARQDVGIRSAKLIFNFLKISSPNQDDGFTAPYQMMVRWEGIAVKTADPLPSDSSSSNDLPNESSLGKRIVLLPARLARSLVKLFMPPNEEETKSPPEVYKTIELDKHQDLRDSVRKAIDLPFPKDANESREQLLHFGAHATPFIAQTIRSDAKMNPIKKAFLVDVIARITGEESGSALIKLLSDDDPLLRGLGATYLGKRKSSSAIPNLIKLLRDQGVYETVAHNDPASEHAVLVRDVAIESLQAVTGTVLAPQGSKEQQAQEWMRWWQAQQKIQTTITYCTPDIAKHWKLANLTFNSLYSFRINEKGEVIEITKLRDDFIGEEAVRSCLAKWRIVGVSRKSPFVVYFNWKRGKGWGEQRVSGNGFTQIMNIGEDGTLEITRNTPKQ